MAVGKMSIAIGDVIGARYCIESVLGQGGMAIVYQARNTGTGKACALKIVHPHLVTRPELVEMFVREAQVAGRIGESPYVVNVFDAGVDEKLGVPFMAMELLKGETLDQYVEARGPMPRTMVRTLFEQLSDALDQAHRSGVIHRDLKPSNLFITYDRRGRPVLKIMDFGIAKVLEHGPQRTATRIGSPAYAAPEQQASAAFRRLAAKHGVTIAQGVSPATDVWALGLVAYELLTGLPKGHYWATLESLDDILIKVAMEESEAATQRAGDRASLLPEGFDDWFARCLRKNAAERWQTPGEAVAVLRRLLAPTDLEIDSTQPLSDVHPFPTRIVPGRDSQEVERGSASPPGDPARPSPLARSAEIGSKGRDKKRDKARDADFLSELAGPDSDTSPDFGSSAPPEAFTPSLSRLPPTSKNPFAPRTDAGAVQTRGTWTRTNAWPRGSKVALMIGGGTFAAVVLVFLFRWKPVDTSVRPALPGLSASVILSTTEPPAPALTAPAPVAPTADPSPSSVESPALSASSTVEAPPSSATPEAIASAKKKKRRGTATPSISSAASTVSKNVKTAKSANAADTGASDVFNIGPSDTGTPAPTATTHSPPFDAPGPPVGPPFP